MYGNTNEESVVICEVADGIAELTFNRPDRMNTFNQQMSAELVRLFRELGEDESVRAIIVTGAGRAFCAGADLGGGKKTFKSGDEKPKDTADGEEDEVLPRNARARYIQPWKIDKPIIAAMQGPAIGVGLTMALQWDMRIVAEDAKYAFAFVQRGVVAEMASTWILPRLVGVARASDLLLSGRIFLGREAAELGVANEALPRDEVLPRAREMARYIAEHCAPASVALTKRLIWEHMGFDDPFLASEREARGLARLGRMPDAAEGVMAFLEKRPAQWKLSAKDAPSVD